MDLSVDMAGAAMDVDTAAAALGKACLGRAGKVGRELTDASKQVMEHHWLCW